MYKISSIFLLMGILLSGKSFNPPDTDKKLIEIHNKALTADTHCETLMIIK